jgi:small subunit ribosomal protein S1
MKVGDEVEAVVLSLDREERKMSLGIKQLKQDPWESIEEKYPVGSKHTATVRNFTNFGVFVEIEEGVDGLIHISDLSWTKKIKHPSEFCKLGDPIDVMVLEIDKENRRLSLGHKQLEENPWDVFETIFTVGSVHEGQIIEMLEKGAIIALPYGVEGFATPKHLVKEDGTQAQLDEKLQFKVIEFNKDSKRIILSHSRIFEDANKTDKPVKRSSRKKKEDTPSIQNQAASTTLGDIDTLAALKEKLDDEKKEAAKEKAAQMQKEEAAAEKKAETVAAEDKPVAEEKPVEEKPVAEKKAPKAKKAPKVEEAPKAEEAPAAGDEEVKPSEEPKA